MRLGRLSSTLFADGRITCFRYFHWVLLDLLLFLPSKLVLNATLSTNLLHNNSIYREIGKHSLYCLFIYLLSIKGMYSVSHPFRRKSVNVTFIRAWPGRLFRFRSDSSLIHLGHSSRQLRVPSCLSTSIFPAASSRMIAGLSRVTRSRSALLLRGPTQRSTATVARVRETRRSYQRNLSTTFIAVSSFFSLF